jgi:hypothetical protein
MPGLFAPDYREETPLTPEQSQLLWSPMEVLCTAGEYIAGHRGVRVDAAGTAWLADPMLTNGRFLVGVSRGAAESGSQLKLVMAGRMQEIGWAWEEGTVWLGPQGTLTQTLPTSYSVIEVGIGTGHILLVRPKLVAVR